MSMLGVSGWGLGVSQSALLRASGYSLQPTAYSPTGGRYAS